MDSISVIPKKHRERDIDGEYREEDIFWKEYPGCSGFIISSADEGGKKCDLR